MYSVAIGYWVFQKTGSNALMGIMSSISMFVTMFLSPFTGSIIDKCSRKWVIVGVDIIQGLMMLAVGILAYTDALNVPLVLVAAFLAAFGSVFYSPAVSTLMIDIIPQDEMVRGRSIHSGVLTTINMVGNAFSGAMVASFGVPLIVVLNGISNLYSAVSELFVRVPRTVQQGDPVTVKSLLKDTGIAVKTVFSEPCLRLFIPTALILNLLSAGPLTLILPFCLEKGFTVDMYGYLASISTVGTLVCVVLLSIFKLSPKVRFWCMAISFVASEVCLILGYCAADYWMVCLFACLGSFLNTAGNSVFNAALMLATPEENRGAILGFITSACTGGTALSALIYGLLGDVFPLYILFALGSALSLVPMLWLCLHRRTKEFILSH
jgi:MFS family permease